MLQPHPRALLAILCALLLARPVALIAADAAAVALVQGTLPNGVRYAVLSHPSPKGDISLRLIVHAGSLDEHDDERGFAHFIEHMAFEGTRRHPPGAVRAFFQRLGLTFGADLNANTSYTHTTYLLDLPDGRAGLLDEALDVLHDYADGLLFPAEQVKSESAVVISELNARDSAGRRTILQLQQVLYAGTPLPNREVGGVAAQLAAATPAQLRAFYERNYLPNRMAVLVVGPVDPTAIVEKISAAFGAIAAAPGAAAPAAAFLPPPVDGIKPDVVIVPTAKGTAVQIMATGSRPPDTIEGRRHELVQRIASAILSTRLVARREREDITQFGPPSVNYEPSTLGPVEHLAALPATATAWTDAVQLLETELRRARTVGFTQAEVDEAVAVQLFAFRNRIDSVAAQPAATVALDVARSLSADRTWQSAEDNLAEGTRALKGLTAAEATAALQEIFPANSCHLVMIVPPDGSTKPERLLAVYTKSAARALKKNSAADEELRFRYEDFGRPGAVAKRDQVADLDLTLVSFENGVRLNVRPSNLEPGRFRLRIVFPQNFSNLSDDRGGIIEFAGQLLLNSNLGKQKESELSRLIKLHGISPQFAVVNGTPMLAMSGPAAELPFALHLLTALLSDLDLDDDHYRVAFSRYAGQQHALDISPGPYALMQTLFVYTGLDQRVVPKTPEVVARYPRDEVEGWLLAHIIHGPLEIGLVGDFTADHAIDAAAASVGTLSRRRAAPAPGRPLVASGKSARHENTAELPASVSVSCVFWPVTLPDEPRANAALALATDVLSDRLLRVLREALGATYTPEAHFHRDIVQRDFAFTAMINTFEPAQAVRLTEGSIRLAGRFAEKGVSLEEFNRLREPARTRRAEQLRNNGWWLDNVVCLAQSHPNVLEEARRHEKIYDEVTIEDVNQAAKTFQPGVATALILRPTPEKK